MAIRSEQNCTHRELGIPIGLNFAQKGNCTEQLTVCATQLSALVFCFVFQNINMFLIYLITCRGFCYTVFTLILDLELKT